MFRRKNRNRSFNGVSSDDNLKRFGNILAKITGVIVLIFLLISVSPTNAIRMTMMLTGAGPVQAIKSTPTHCEEGSYNAGADMYGLPEKQAYTFDVDKIQYFRVYTFLIFHFAFPTPVY
ncbi:hypothetical protein [Lentilactobacillus diolivorans]|nr:hypothetical protein [Lentilactobacillus diolivorans]GEP23612.1 hypothetical protein LDI01_12050 [Lentilactobacillus diolivorans]